MNIGAFFPLFAYNNHQLTQTSIGILFSVYQVAYIFAAVWVGKNMEEVGRRKIVVYSIGSMTVSTLMFGLASQFRETLMFYSASFLARAVQGAAGGMMEVAVPAIISQ